MSNVNSTSMDILSQITNKKYRPVWPMEKCLSARDGSSVALLGDDAGGAGREKPSNVASRSDDSPTAKVTDEC